MLCLFLNCVHAVFPLERHYERLSPHFWDSLGSCLAVRWCLKELLKAKRSHEAKEEEAKRADGLMEDLRKRLRAMELAMQQQGLGDVPRLFMSC